MSAAAHAHETHMHFCTHQQDTPPSTHQHSSRLARRLAVRRPVGPYKEVCVLSGLVARGASIGAWASHIIVTTPEASASGRALFGLPTRLGAIDCGAPQAVAASAAPGEAPSAPASPPPWSAAAWEIAVAVAVALKTVAGTAAPGVAEPAERLGASGTRRQPAEPPLSVAFESDEHVNVRGWGATADGDGEASSGASISLPSFSGLLPVDEQRCGGEMMPLLRYPLKLGPARRMRLRTAARISLQPCALSEDLRAVLDGPCASPCLQVDGVRIVAGRPEACG